MALYYLPETHPSSLRTVYLPNGEHLTFGSSSSRIALCSPALTTRGRLCAPPACRSTTLLPCPSGNTARMVASELS